MKGRLIQKFKARLGRLDTVTQAAAGDFDTVLREPVKRDATGDGHGALVRTERTADVVPCQVGNNRWENRAQTDLGNDPDGDVVLYFFAKDLEEASLFDAATGRPLIQVGTRLLALLDCRDETTVLDYGAGLFCEESSPVGWGLSMARPRRNLVRAVFRRRKRGSR
jgi:hypothetical protein